MAFFHTNQKGGWVAHVCCPRVFPKQLQISYSASTASPSSQGSPPGFRNYISLNSVWRSLGKWVCCPALSNAVPQISTPLSQGTSLLIVTIHWTRVQLLMQVCELFEVKAKSVLLTIDSTKPRPMFAESGSLTTVECASKIHPRYSYVDNTHTPT